MRRAWFDDDDVGRGVGPGLCPRHLRIGHDELGDSVRRARRGGLKLGTRSEK